MNLKKVIALEKLIVKAVKKIEGKEMGSTEVVTWAPDFKKTEAGLIERDDYNDKVEQFKNVITLYNGVLAHFRLQLRVNRVGYGMSPYREEWGTFLLLSVI